jgi:large subunit ribosomal protein L4
MPRKARRAALRSALATKVAEGHLVVVDELKLPAPKTREMVAFLSAVPVESSALVVVARYDEDIVRASRNLRAVKVLQADLLNIADLLDYDFVVMPEAVVAQITETLGL